MEHLGPFLLATKLWIPSSLSTHNETDDREICSLPISQKPSHWTSEASVTAHDSEMSFFPFSGLNSGFTRPQGAARAVFPIYFVLPVVLIFSFYYLRRLPPESGKLEPRNERSDTSGRSKKTPGDKSSANLTPSEGVSPDEGNASNKTLPPAAEPGLQILHDSDAPKIEYVNVDK